MKVEVVTPEEFMGDAIGDLNIEGVKWHPQKLEVMQQLLTQQFR